MGASWIPLVEGEEAETVRKVASEIALTLRDFRPAAHLGGLRGRPRRAEEAYLGRGDAGLAVAYWYLARALDDDGLGEDAADALDRAAAALAEVQMGPSLFHGFAGVALAAHWLSGAAGSGEEDPGEEIDETLAAYLEGAAPADYDLISGLVGIGVYGLERLPRPAARSCVEAVLRHLEETARPMDGGLAWHTAPELLPPETRATYPAGYFNVGVAHGSPGVIGFLAAAAAAGIDPPRARDLAGGAASWLLAQRIDGDVPAQFPYCVAQGTAGGGPSRAGWCYGDPGIAALLIWSARVLEFEELEKEALELARFAARRPSEGSGVNDTGLCHGSGGLTHIFNRLYQATGEGEFARAARSWLAATLQMRTPGEGVAGFRFWHAEAGGEGTLVSDPAFLGGAGGLAMALAATVTDTPPGWDRLLLLSQPGAP